MGSYLSVPGAGSSGGLSTGAALASVPSTDARPTFFPGSRTRLAVMAATSTPMKEVPPPGGRR